MGSGFIDNLDQVHSEDFEAGGNKTDQDQQDTINTQDLHSTAEQEHGPW